MTPIFFGGMLKLWLERRSSSKKEAVDRRDKGVLLSLALYVATYAIIFGAGVYFILQTVRQGPR